MKYYIIAGEASADLHGSNLMRGILRRDPAADFRYWGGERMMTVARGLDIHIRETAIMGFVEVVKNLPKIKSFFNKTKKSISEFEPDVIVLIDYPGFNLRLAKWAHSCGYKIVYYISPQVWAWKKNRKESIKKYVDLLITILPFEKSWYAQEGVTNVEYVGHPLLEAIDQYQYDDRWKKEHSLSSKYIAVLPGSRSQEVEKNLPVMLHAAKSWNKDVDIVIAGSRNIDKQEYEKWINTEDDRIHMVYDKTYDILRSAHLALVTSGTATLETALHDVPQVVCYKTSSVNYFIGKRLVTLPHISLVNLIAGEEVVPELIQNEFNTDQVVTKLTYIDTHRNEIAKKYKALRQVLKVNETPSEKAAQLIIHQIRT